MTTRIFLFWLHAAFALPVAAETTDPILPSVPIEKLSTLDLIGLLADSSEVTRTRTYDRLIHQLVEDTEAPGYYDVLTDFHKHAPHACRQNQHEGQTLLILAIFGAQKEVSSVLLQECLRSSFASVRADALAIAHFSDNPITDTLLAFEPDPATRPALHQALRRLASASAHQRIQELGLDAEETDDRATRRR